MGDNPKDDREAPDCQICSAEAHSRWKLRLKASILPTRPCDNEKVLKSFSAEGKKPHLIYPCIPLTSTRTIRWFQYTKSVMPTLKPANTVHQSTQDFVSESKV